VDSGTKEVLNPAPAAPEMSAPSEPIRPNPAAVGFYRVRYYFYMSLMVFVVAVGLPIVSIPVIRHRLSDRVQTLREAMAGGRIKPIEVKVGENKEPFPAEFAKKASAPNYPKLPPYFAATQGLSGPIVSSTPIPRPAGEARSRRTIRIPKVPAEPASEPAAADSGQAPATDQAAGAATEAQPAYQQGLMEKEAYDLLLKSNATVAAMVQGSNPSLKFKSWDALKRDEDTYYVRLTFASLPANTSTEYIWQVKLLAKQVTPLSYAARSLANPQ
jgi:hypothetical protein